jgi:hypothetical protein
MKFMMYGAMSFIVKDGRMSARRMTWNGLKIITALSLSLFPFRHNRDIV